jgi:DNA-binding NtrC family response regulator
MTSSQSSVPEHYQDVLVVEDDPIIALGLEDTITDLGIAVIRVAANVASALAMIEERAPQFALLDVGLVREKSFAIAERLTTLGIPFAFSTGYGADRVPAAFADRPRLPKPCPTEALEAVLRVSSAAASSAELRVKGRRPQRDVGAIAQGHGHLPGLALDLDVPEELHAG